MDWSRLAQAVIDRRVELGYRTRESFASATGLSSRLLGDIERSQRDNYDRVTLARLEQALQWEPGTARTTLISGSGGETPAAVHPLAAGLTALLADPDLPAPARSALLATVDRAMTRARRAAHGMPDPHDDELPLGDFLTALIAADSSIRREDKVALRQIMAAAVQLGQTAMMAADVPGDDPAYVRAVEYERGGLKPGERLIQPQVTVE